MYIHSFLPFCLSGFPSKQDCCTHLLVVDNDHRMDSRIVIDNLYCSSGQHPQRFLLNTLSGLATVYVLHRACRKACSNRFVSTYTPITRELATTRNIYLGAVLSIHHNCYVKNVQDARFTAYYDRLPLWYTRQHAYPQLRP